MSKYMSCTQQHSFCPAPKAGLELEKATIDLDMPLWACLSGLLFVSDTASILKHLDAQADY